jgi:hypothetical protein
LFKALHSSRIRCAGGALSHLVAVFSGCEVLPQERVIVSIQNARYWKAGPKRFIDALQKLLLSWRLPW